ncbi:MAG: hypothetical protein A3C61_03890 [Candidatus Yanofskybacteria bacterium RIFCSPHIGHO2_02_FULL_39_10]|uniref:Uncharacterized protein n=1 Tax=Candidatus Yanofskybacteria bacterium RIFCSPHIGHO2_02_FULL_39_10 TaxID=1802674 RepID=A0A1F8F7Z6_9BACT|nr:MAG: hypothetical protein A3C61_03890 [Candidatus Yanofskybacteria bacterium RIFCSPHIGHO2_02_FULL_39_10]
MRKDKEQAIALRRQNKSYKQISRDLNIPLSTLAGWLKDEPWSQDIRDKLGLEASLAFPEKLKRIVTANRKRWAGIHETYRREAIVEFEDLKDNPLFLAGIMLYWGEGEKQSKYSVVRLSNSEPEMIRIFYLFLTKALKVTPDKIKAWLLLYPDLIDSVQKNFWSKATGLSKEQFNKSIYIKGRHPTKRLSYGVCTIVIQSRALKERMLKWLELYQDFLRSHALKLEK